jgi:molybdopterin/thiamine biosynthesis adenylyltransferase
VNAADHNAADHVESRFDRQRLIAGWDQDVLAAGTAVVVGVGALGNEVAKNLALAGVGRLILCDPDVVSASNLSRTVLFRDADVGRPKSEAAAEALRRLAPAVEVVPRHADLVSGVGLGELADAAVVLGCVDTRNARIRLLDRCALVEAPLVDGGTLPWAGEVRVRVSTADPCYACTLTEHERGESDLPWSCTDPPTDTPVPASILASALVGSWMSMTAVQIMFGARPVAPVFRFDAGAGTVQPVEVGREPSCPHHRPLDGPVTRIPLTARSTVAELLALVPDDAIVLTWLAFPVKRLCVHQSSEYRELSGPASASASAAAFAHCPECGQRVRMSSSQQLRDADPAARLADLGVAPGEILTVRAGGGDYTWFRLSDAATSSTTARPVRPHRSSR